MTDVQVSKTVRPDRPDLSEPGRVSEWLRDRYMLNPRDADFDDVLQEILRTGPDGGISPEPMRIPLVDETRGLLVTGETRDGKTTLIRRNLLRNPQIGLTKDTGQGRAFYARVKGEATLKGLAADIVKATGYPSVSDRLRASEIWDLAVHRLRQQGITILWIDEAHHLLRDTRDVKTVLRRFKTLMQGESSFALILSGIPELDTVIRQDPETSDRFFRLRLGLIRTDADRGSLQSYFNRCCQLVELLPPADPHLIQRIEMATRGAFGRSIELIQYALYRALKRRDGYVRLEDFRRSYQNLRGRRGEDGPFDETDWPTLKEILDKQGWS